MRPTFFSPVISLIMPPTMRATDRRRMWLGMFVGLGLIARLIRYALCFPLWADELMFTVNLIDRSPSDLLTPLGHNQVAPLGFLWIELQAIHWLGFSERSLRLFPLVCGLASVVLFAYLASRIVRGNPLLLAVAIFSVAYYPMRLAVEVKPYASDLFFSLLLVTWLVEWWRNRTQTRWLWGMTATVPFAVAISFPAVFVAGAVGLTAVLLIFKDRVWRALFPLAAYGTLLIGTFGAVFWFSAQVQHQAAGSQLTDCWADDFPPASLTALPFWLLRVHTSEMLAYPVGGQNGGSIVTALFCVCGVIVLWKSHRRTPLFLFGATLGLALLAAALHRYPYGGHARLMQFIAGPVCIVTGAGLAFLIRKIPQLKLRRLATVSVYGALALLGTGLVLRDCTQPYKKKRDHEHRQFVRKLWASEPGWQTVSVLRDLHLDIYPAAWNPGYLVNHAICNRSSATPGSTSPLAADRLRCVLYQSVGCVRDDAALAKWLAEMQRDYRLVGEEQHPVRVYSDELTCSYQVYSFERIAQTAAGAERPLR